MSIEENIQTVKDFFAAMGGTNKQELLAVDSDEVGHAFQFEAGH